MQSYAHADMRCATYHDTQTSENKTVSKKSPSKKEVICHFKGCTTCPRIVHMLHPPTLTHSQFGKDEENGRRYEKGKSTKFKYIEAPC